MLLPLGDDAQAVAVAVEGQAQFGVGLGQGADHVAQVLGLARVGVVVGEVAVHLAEELDHLAAQGAEQRGRRGTGHAVAAVHHDLHRPRELHVAHDAVAVGGGHVDVAHAPALGALAAVAFDELAQRLDVVAVDGAATHHHLEAVVVLGVVAARDLDAAVAQRGGGEVQHGRGDHAHVDHVDARGHQATDERGRQRRPAQAPVAAHGHGALALPARHGAEGQAQGFGHALVQRARHDAAHVIGLEDGGGHLHAGAPGMNGQKRAL
jgi:hypothetical protein